MDEEQEESHLTTYRARKKPSPFAEEILLEELPNNFRSPHVGEYDGTTGPEEHLYKFENAAILH